MNKLNGDFWQAAYLVALAALLRRHHVRRLPASVAAHLATEYASASMSELRRHLGRRNGH